MSVRLSCPSCNANFAVEAVPHDRRATCPRCGDAFPVRGVLEESENRGQRTEDIQPVISRESQSRAVAQGGRRVARFALALGLIALAFGLAFYYARPKPHPEPVPPPTAAKPPAQLEGLGYLPAECNVVFALQPGPVIAFAERTNREPREMLLRAGIPPQLFAILDQTGLALSQFNHVAGGVYLGEGEVKAALVLVLNQPLANEGDLLDRLKAKPVAGKKFHYEVKLENAIFSPVLVRASPTVWVLGLANSLTAADANNGPGGAHFRGSESTGLRKMIASVPQDAAYWAAADDDDDWTKKPVLMLISKQLPNVKAWLPAAKDGRGGVMAVSLGEQPRLKLVVRAADEKTGERVRAYFMARAAKTPTATAGGEGEFAHFDAPFDPAASWGMVQKFLEDAK